MPKCSAVSRSIRPAGNGRLCVRFITASISDSYHWLSAAEAPAPRLIARIAVKPITGWMVPGAASNPHKAVNMTSDITRGLVSAKRSFALAKPCILCDAVVIFLSKFPNGPQIT